MPSLGLPWLLYVMFPLILRESGRIVDSLKCVFSVFIISVMRMTQEGKGNWRILDLVIKKRREEKGWLSPLVKGRIVSLS